jgi:hypothetical protein
LSLCQNWHHRVSVKTNVLKLEYNGGTHLFPSYASTAQALLNHRFASRFYHTRANRIMMRRVNGIVHLMAMILEIGHRRR